MHVITEEGQDRARDLSSAAAFLHDGGDQRQQQQRQQGRSGLLTPRCTGRLQDCHGCVGERDTFYFKQI